MYESHFGFDGPPFQLYPDPAFLYGSAGHNKALSYLRYGLQQGEGFIVITGEVGAGKTTLVRAVLQELKSDDVVAAQVSNTQLDATDLLQTILTAFGVPHQGLGKARLIATLEAFLTAVAASGRRALLVVDEAQNLGPQAIEELRLLSNFQIGHHGLLQCFLVGQPELRLQFQTGAMEQLRQRVLGSYHLGPLEPAETAAYIEHRLRHVKWAGRPAFEPAAMLSIHERTGGIPRRINILCNRLLLAAYLGKRASIDAALVTETADELAQELQRPAAMPVKAKAAVAPVRASVAAIAPAAADGAGPRMPASTRPAAKAPAAAAAVQPAAAAVAVPATSPAEVPARAPASAVSLTSDAIFASAPAAVVERRVEQTAVAPSAPVAAMPVASARAAATGTGPERQAPTATSTTARASAPVEAPATAAATAAAVTPALSATSGTSATPATSGTSVSSATSAASVASVASVASGTSATPGAPDVSGTPASSDKPATPRDAAPAATATSSAASLSPAAVSATAAAPGLVVAPVERPAPSAMPASISSPATRQPPAVVREQAANLSEATDGRIGLVEGALPGNPVLCLADNPMDWLKLRCMARHWAGEADLPPMVLVNPGARQTMARSWQSRLELSIAAPEVHLGVGPGPAGQTASAIVLRFADLIAESDPSAVLVAGAGYAAVHAAAMAHQLGVPVVRLEGGARRDDVDSGAAAVAAMLDRSADLLLVHSELERDTLLAERFDAAQVVQVGDFTATVLRELQPLLPPFESLLARLGAPREWLERSASGFALLTGQFEDGDVGPEDAMKWLLMARHGCAELPLLWPASERTVQVLREPALQLQLDAVGIVVVRGCDYFQKLSLLARARCLISGPARAGVEEATAMAVPSLVVQFDDEVSPVAESIWVTRLGPSLSALRSALRAAGQAPRDPHVAARAPRDAAREAVEELGRWLPRHVNLAGGRSEPDEVAAA